MKEIKIKINLKIRKTLHHSSYSSKNSQQSTVNSLQSTVKIVKTALLAFAHCFSSTNRSSKNAKILGIFDNFLTACTRAYYFPRNYGPDTPYVAVFPDPSVAGSLKSARENSSALESRVS